MIFRARYEFRAEDTPPGQALSGSIQYTADSGKEAIESFKRWWKCRQRNVPEHFSKIFALTIHEVRPQRITADGYMNQDLAGMAVEWKVDFPWAGDFWQD